MKHFFNPSWSVMIRMILLIGICMVMVGCPNPSRVNEEQPRANSIAESTMSPEDQQSILAGAAMKLHPIGRLRVAQPEMLELVVRPPIAPDNHDFLYSLFFDAREGVYWLGEQLPTQRGLRWYGPIMPDSKTIERLTPDDFVPVAK